MSDDTKHDNDEELQDEGPHPSQQSFFDPNENVEWRQHWKGMPEFVQENLQPVKQIIVSFETWADMAAFAKLTDQQITPDTRSIWYPKLVPESQLSKRYVNES